MDDDKNVFYVFNVFTDHLLQPSHVRNVWILSAGITKPLRHTSQCRGNTMGAETGILITSSLSYLSRKPLAVISECVLRDASNNRAGNSPSPPPEYITSTVQNKPVSQQNWPWFKPNTSTFSILCRKAPVYYLTCTDGSARRRECYARLDRRRRKRIRARARIGYSLIYNWQCFSVEKPALICCLITDFHHHVQIPLRGFCGLFARCLCCLHCKLAFQKGTSPSGHSLQVTHKVVLFGVFFFIVLPCPFLLLSGSRSNLQLTFKPLWII